MIDFKKYFPDNDDLSSMDEDSNDDGLTCSCPRHEHELHEGKRIIKNLHLNGNIPKDIKKYKTYHLRSVNLNQILGSNSHQQTTPEDVDFVPRDEDKYHKPTNFASNRRGLTSSGSSFGGSTDNSPDGNSPDGDLVCRRESSPKKELTDFERDNLLYLQELKERRKNLYKYYEPQVKELPYFPLGYSKNLSSGGGFTKYNLKGDNLPREGSPFPRRKEYPRTAFSPSNATPSKILRCQSLDEEEEDDDEDDDEELSYRRRGSRPSHLFRNFSEPGYRSNPVRYPAHEETCQLNTLSSDAWWSHKPATSSNLRGEGAAIPMSSPPPSRKRVNNLGELKLPLSSGQFTRSSAPSTPIAVPPLRPGLSSSTFAKDSYKRRSYSSPSIGDQLPFAPLDLTLSFSSFKGLQKCRPELEDVGGQFKSILATSPEEEEGRRSFLPITQESIMEDTSDEDTSRKQLESKFPTSPSSESKPSPLSSSLNEISATPERPSVTPRKNDPHPSPVDSPPNTVTKPPTPMAFTIELGDSAASDSSGSGSTGKKLDISASISQWAPKHRRNLSLTKVDEHKKIEERQNSDKPPLGRPRAGTVGAGSLGNRKGGYHSEGYFSSDQDDEGTKRIDLKSPRSPRAHDTVKSPLSIVRSSSQDSSKDNSARMRPPSPVSSPSSPYAVPLNESASVLLEKMMNATPETKRKLNSKPEGRSCCKERERKPSVSELTGKSYSKSEKDSVKMGSDSKKQARNTPTDDIDPIRDEKDDVSEAGTYTIDKDSPSPDMEQARDDIDRVFGVPVESEAEMTSSTAVPMSTTDQGPEDESSWMSASEMAPTISRNSPNWIQQWAAQVAEQTKPSLEPISPHCKLSLQSPRGHKLPLSSQDSNDSRPRRKLPTPPSQLSKSSAPPPRTLDMSDSENSKNRARVDKTKGVNPAFRNSSFESHESGGDSDLDTSTSYQFHDDEKLSASIRSKLRLTGLHPIPKNLASSPSSASCSPRRPEIAAAVDPRHLNREATYDLYPARRDERVVQSDDSSSETSEPYKDPPPRISDNNPPLKFNRAFSLRRARLGCDEPSVPLPAEKKKVVRPSSAGAVSSSRNKTPLGATKSYQSVDNTSGVVKSPSKTTIHKREPQPSSNSKKNGQRSNSTLTSKEVDFQNWKRRKNYDPMKAAAEGRKKQVERKVKDSPEPPSIPSDNRSPSPLGSLLRSASFHGTEGGMGNMRWSKRPNPSQPHHYTSEDDGPFSLEEEIRHNPSPRHGSPLMRSPTSPHQLCQSPARQPPNAMPRGRRPSLGHTEEGEAQYQSSSRKISLDETGSEGKRSPMNGVIRGASAGPSSSGGGGRPKTKMEALDNLVISTIHSMSVKVRTTSESLLQKLKSQYDEEGDRAALLEEVLSHLSESDQSLASGQSRSTSRELAGILRNLKKIEHALGVIDRVIIVGDDEYEDDDLLDEVPHDWVDESDY